MPAPASLASVKEFFDYFFKICSKRNIAKPELVRRCIYGDNTYHSLRFEEVITCISAADPDLSCLSFLKITPNVSPNLYHRYLADRINEGKLVITTNFDALIEMAYWEAFGENIDTANGRLWKIHGSLQTVSDGEIIDEDTSKLKTDIVAVASGNSINSDVFELDDIIAKISNSSISIWGYSFSDSYDVSPVLKKSRPTQAYILEYNPGEIIELESTAKILSPNFDEIGISWRINRTRLRPLVGDLHSQIREDAISRKMYEVKLGAKRTDNRFVAIEELIDTELLLIIGRLCMYQDAYADANKFFRSVMQDRNRPLASLGLYYYLKSLQDWAAVVEYQQALKESELELTLKLQSYVVLLDAAAFLVDIKNFLRIFKEYRLLVVSAKGKLRVEELDLIRSKAAHSCSIYFLTSGRPTLAELSAKVSLKFRENYGGPDDILYAQFAVCMSKAYKGEEAKLRSLLVNLRTYSRMVGGMEAQIVVLIAEGLYLLLKRQPLKANERFKKVILLYSGETGDGKRDPEIELYSLIASISSNESGGVLRSKIDELESFIRTNGYVGLIEPTRFLRAKIMKENYNSFSPLSKSFKEFLSRA